MTYSLNKVSMQHGANSRYTPVTDSMTTYACNKAIVNTDQSVKICIHNISNFIPHIYWVGCIQTTCRTGNLNRNNQTFIVVKKGRQQVNDTVTSGTVKNCRMIICWGTWSNTDCMFYYTLHFIIYDNTLTVIQITELYRCQRTSRGQLPPGHLLPPPDNLFGNLPLGIYPSKIT